MAEESLQRKGTIYKINLIGGKCYIGKTITPLEKRMGSHAYIALSEKPKETNNILPFLPPYRNFCGKDSSLCRLITEHKKASHIKSLSKREQRKWLKAELIRRTEVIDEITIYGSSNKRAPDPLTDRYDLNNPLAMLERKYIYDAWIENPRQLVNYNGLPFHSEMKFELFKVQNVSLEKLGNLAFLWELGRYQLLWDEFFYTDEQQLKWETVAKNMQIERLDWYNNLSPEEREIEDACDFASPNEVSSIIIEKALSEQQLQIDRKIITDNRKSIFSKKKAELAKELKRLEGLSPDERREIIQKKYLS